MADPAKEQPIYLIKKKVHGHGHHGGAWKVAYADFVTAMMAFFMVMWLMGSSEKVKNSVSGYFRDPSGFKKQSGTGMSGEGEQITLSKDDMEGLKDKIQSAMKQMPDFKQIKDHVTMTVTGEGLRIELLEKEKGMFFQSGSATPSEFGKEIIEKMSGELAKLPNTIAIEGHTDSKPFSEDGIYSNWELSTDRANAARRLMSSSGLRADQVKQLRGFADQNLMDVKDPTAAKNRRISIIVQYLRPAYDPADDEEDPKDAHGKKDAHGGGHGDKGEKKDAGHGEAKKDEPKPAKPSAAH
jgi:chemotaxis protein MotB